MLFPKIHSKSNLLTSAEESSRKLSWKLKPDYDPDTLFNQPPPVRFDLILILLFLYIVRLMLASQFFKDKQLIKDTFRYIQRF